MAKKTNNDSDKPVPGALKPSIGGKLKYRRIPICRKVMGSGQNDTQRLIQAGIPEEMADIALDTGTGVWHTHTGAAGKNGMRVFSTTRLLQMLPPQFLINGEPHIITIQPAAKNEFGLGTLSGAVVNLEKQTVVFSHTGHPVSVLVRLLEYAQGLIVSERAAADTRH